MQKYFIAANNRENFVHYIKNEFRYILCITFYGHLRRNKKDGRERSQRAGAEDGADERVEGVNVHSPGSGSGAGRGERGRGTQEHKRTYVKAARCTAAHSRPVSSSSILHP